MERNIETSTDKKCIDCNVVKKLTDFPKSEKRNCNYCYDCKNFKKRKYYNDNIDKKRANAKKYRLENLQKVKDYHKNYKMKRIEDNPLYAKKLIEYCIKCYYKNHEEYKLKAKLRRRIDLLTKKDYINNLRKVSDSKRKTEVLEKARFRDLKKKNATIGRFKEELIIIYKNCKIVSQNTKVNHQVDHIIPIKHKDICGLHVPWNLQILTASDNARKCNNFDGTYENNKWRSKK